MKLALFIFFALCAVAYLAIDAWLSGREQSQRWFPLDDYEEERS